jgi:2-methylcitrate dehydratase
MAGITSPEDTIESAKAGLKRVVMADGVLELGLLGGKDKPFMIERSVIKAFPIGGGVHLSCFAALDLRQKVRADEIASVVVKTESYGKSTSAQPEHWTPKTRETADHSIPIAVAIALVDGEFTADSWKRERYKAAEVLDLVAKIRVDEDAEFSRQYPAKKNIIIEAKTHSGETRAVHKVMTADDEKTSDEMIEAKFLRYAENVLTPHQAKATLEAVWQLDSLEKAGQILDNMLM